MSEGQSNEGVPVSIGTAILAVIMIASACFTIGLGLGYFFGTSNSYAAQITGVCSAMVRAHEGELSAIKINFDQMKFKTDRYETFLLGTGATLEEALAADPKTRVKKGVGGGP